MTYVYSQRSLMVLSSLGILSGIMSLLSVILIFQIQSQQIAVKESPPKISIMPTNVWEVLMPVSTVLSTLSLTLNLSSVMVCLLHSYFTTEICRGEEDTERADWFLLHSQAVRHVAIGLFCLGVSVYLAAARTAQHYHGGEYTDTLYQNQHSGCTPAVRHGELQDGDKPRRHRNNSQLHRQLSYPPCTDPKQHHQHHSPSHGPQSHGSDKEGYSSGGSGGGSRMHRTLSTESGPLQSPSTPWNGINNEMRSVLARKSGASSKDSTLV
ncbi:unnamed protein product [Coregonus sp. 'balchen']|nr:unnamed protein product [Coregonus sp. 'balchen']